MRPLAYGNIIENLVSRLRLSVNTFMMRQCYVHGKDGSRSMLDTDQRKADVFIAESFASITWANSRLKVVGFLVFGPPLPNPLFYFSMALGGNSSVD